MIKRICFILIKIFKRLFFFSTNILILIISLIIPKSDKVILVGGWFGKRFADNSKYFFLYVNENKKKLGVEKIVWITRSDSIKNELRNQGLKAYKVWSLLSIWYHFRAKIHLIDQSINDINPFFSVRSIRINLWHGFPLKKIGSYQEDFNNFKNITNNAFFKYLSDLSIRGFWGKKYLLTTSEFSAKILGKAFSIPKEKIIISCYPRNYEPIVSKPIKYVSENEKEYLNLVEKAKEQGNTIIGYFPTFRDKKETLIFGTQDHDELQGLLDYFQKSNIKVIGKFHFAGKNDKFRDIHNHEAFINLPSDADVYTFLSEVDILITDYSSIYFDFLLWERPIVFFPYDLDYYRDEDRGLIFEYDEFTPGDKVFNISELKNLLECGVDLYKQRYYELYGKEAKVLARKIFDEYEKMQLDHLFNKINSL